MHWWTQWLQLSALPFSLQPCAAVLPSLARTRTPSSRRWCWPQVCCSTPPPLLLAKGWYQRHREALLLLCGGGGRAVMAAGQGVMSLATGQDYCSDPGNWLGMLLVSSALHFPIAQQVRLRGALLLALVDACGLCCYALFKLGALLPAVGLAGAAAGVGLAVVALLMEWRGRRAFLRLVRPAGGHM